MIANRKPRVISLSSSLNSQIPKYLETKNCGVCLSANSLNIHSTYPSLYMSEAVLFVCSKCTAVYNSETETKELANRDRQIDWLDQQNIYNLSTELREFESLVL